MRTCVALRGVAAAAVWVVSCAGASAGSDIAVIPGIGPPVAAPSPQRIRGTGLGGGFLEFVATGHSGVIYNNPDGNMPEYAAPLLQPARTHAYAMVEPRPLIGDVPEVQGSVRSEFMRREISYGGAEQPGTVVVDTPHK